MRPSQAARRIAERDGVEIRLYSVIYQAIEEVKDAMAGMLAPELREEITGSAEILETYHISRVGTIAGCMVREGKIKRSCKVRLIRQGIVRYTGELGSLKRFKDDVKEVASGYDCGISIKGYNDIAVGDIIEAFEEERGSIRQLYRKVSYTDFTELSDVQVAELFKHQPPAGVLL